MLNHLALSRGVFVVNGVVKIAEAAATWLSQLITTAIKAVKHIFSFDRERRTFTLNIERWVFKMDTRGSYNIEFKVTPQRREG